MLRTIVMLLFLLFVGIVSLVLIPIAALVGVFNKKKRLGMSFAFARWCLKVFRCLSGAEVTYKGLENLADKTETAVYIGNHRGLFDIVFLYSVLKGPTGFVAKKEMHTWPVISWWMGFVNCLFMDRKNQVEGIKSLLKGIEYVKDGTSMVIFPEGTRSKVEGEMLDFKAGSFKLATKPQVKIIPVVFNNTSQVFEDHVPYVKKAKAVVEILPPIETKGLTADELKNLPAEVHGLILEKTRENGKLIGSIT